MTTPATASAPKLLEETFQLPVHTEDVNEVPMTKEEDEMAFDGGGL